MNVSEGKCLPFNAYSLSAHVSHCLHLTQDGGLKIIARNMCIDLHG